MHCNKVNGFGEVLKDSFKINKHGKMTEIRLCIAKGDFFFKERMIRLVNHWSTDTLEYWCWPECI